MKKVPLVMYKGGERVVIGEAEIEENDTGLLVSAKIDPEHSDLLVSREQPELELGSQGTHDYNVTFLAEVDRNARGYGYEIGAGHPLTTEIKELSEDNPFLDKDWKERMVEEVTTHPTSDHNHKPVQHTDDMPAWCEECGLTGLGKVPATLEALTKKLSAAIDPLEGPNQG